jgi:hypothetical protein
MTKPISKSKIELQKSAYHLQKTRLKTQDQNDLKEKSSLSDKKNLTNKIYNALIHYEISNKNDLLKDSQSSDAAVSQNATLILNLQKLGSDANLRQDYLQYCLLGSITDAEGKDQTDQFFNTFDKNFRDLLILIPVHQHSTIDSIRSGLFSDSSRLLSKSAQEFLFTISKDKEALENDLNLVFKRVEGKDSHLKKVNASKVGNYIFSQKYDHNKIHQQCAKHWIGNANKTQQTAQNFILNQKAFQTEFGKITKEHLLKPMADNIKRTTNNLYAVNMNQIKETQKQIQFYESYGISEFIEKNKIELKEETTSTTMDQFLNSNALEPEEEPISNDQQESEVNGHAQKLTLDEIYDQIPKEILPIASKEVQKNFVLEFLRLKSSYSLLNKQMNSYLSRKISELEESKYNATIENQTEIQEQINRLQSAKNNKINKMETVFALCDQDMIQAKKESENYYIESQKIAEEALKISHELIIKNAIEADYKASPPSLFYKNLGDNLIPMIQKQYTEGIDIYTANMEKIKNIGKLNDREIAYNEELKNIKDAITSTNDQLEKVKEKYGDDNPTSQDKIEKIKNHLNHLNTQFNEKNKKLNETKNAINALKQTIDESFEKSGFFHSGILKKHLNIMQNLYNYSNNRTQLENMMKKIDNQFPILDKLSHVALETSQENVKGFLSSKKGENSYSVLRPDWLPKENMGIFNILCDLSVKLEAAGNTPEQQSAIVSNTVHKLFGKESEVSHEAERILSEMLFCIGDFTLSGKDYAFLAHNVDNFSELAKQDLNKLDLYKENKFRKEQGIAIEETLAAKQLRSKNFKMIIAKILNAAAPKPTKENRELMTLMDKFLTLIKLQAEVNLPGHIATLLNDQKEIQEKIAKAERTLNEAIEAGIPKTETNALSDQIKALKHEYIYAGDEGDEGYDGNTGEKKLLTSLFAKTLAGYETASAFQSFSSFSFENIPGIFSGIFIKNKINVETTQKNIETRNISLKAKIDGDLQSQIEPLQKKMVLLNQYKQEINSIDPQFFSKISKSEFQKTLSNQIQEAKEKIQEAKNLGLDTNEMEKKVAHWENDHLFTDPHKVLQKIHLKLSGRLYSGTITDVVKNYLDREGRLNQDSKIDLEKSSQKIQSMADKIKNFKALEGKIQNKHVSFFPTLEAKKHSLEINIQTAKQVLIRAKRFGLPQEELQNELTKLEKVLTVFDKQTLLLQIFNHKNSDSTETLNHIYSEILNNSEIKNEEKLMRQIELVRLKTKSLETLERNIEEIDNDFISAFEEKRELISVKIDAANKAITKARKRNIPVDPQLLKQKALLEKILQNIENDHFITQLDAKMRANSISTLTGELLIQTEMDLTTLESETFVDKFGNQRSEFKFDLELNKLKKAISDDQSKQK